MKRVGIMQAYFMPYIGYFQLINAVDEFVIYDNIQYTKKGWINRNRILNGDGDKYITLPLKKDSDYLNIGERFLADSFERNKLSAQIRGVYQKAPYYNDVLPLMNSIIYYENDNLFEYIYNSVTEVCKYLEIHTPIVISSELKCDVNLKGQDKVIAICKERDCDMYINAIGGVELYDSEQFLKEGMELRFIKTELKRYAQFANAFVPALSIIDVLMFNSKSEVQKMLLDYSLIE